jgi:toxin-antitoxin system PIN domain toxin
MSNPRFLFDVNALIALTDPDHQHHPTVTNWFNSGGRHDWGVCAFTESGFIRITCNPRLGNRTVEQATHLLQLLSERPGYRYWPISARWTTLAAPFRERVFGHQQVTDAFLLGLAIQEDGILVTMDKAIRSMAGPQFSRHVLVLE